jgi:hypothetical protein
MTARGPTSFDSKWLIGVLLILLAGGTLSGATAHAEECLAAPNSPAREGTRWRYRLDWATQHKCWYLREIDQPTQQMSGHAESAPPAPALATTIAQPGPATTGSAFSVSRANPTPSSSNREEIDTKSTAVPPLGGPTPDTTSPIPKEFASQRAGTSFAAPAPTDEITSAISDMHQAAPTTPYSERLGGATTNETGSSTSDLAVPLQAASSSELNAQMAGMAPHESAAPTDERIDNAGRWVSPLYFIVAFLLALVVQFFMPTRAAAIQGFSSVDAGA